MSDYTWRDKVFVLSQYAMPHHVQSLLVYWVTRRRWRWLNRLLMPWFIRRYGVDMSITVEPDWHRYENFNSLFTRALKPEARPIANGNRQVACPVDGTVSQAGAIEGERVFQAKGHAFPLTELLGGSTERAQPFVGGSFATLYLSPRDYHRIHMPVQGSLREMVYIPGRLYSVNAVTAAHIPRLFARNERVVCMFDTEAGPMAMVLVGALHVGSIETVWHGQVTPPYRFRSHRWAYASGTGAVLLERGQEMGRFNLGSTVIVLFGADALQLDAAISAGSPVEMGRLLGSLGS